jgi:D-3-phosphoglycerate dehydrogenase
MENIVLLGDYERVFPLSSKVPKLKAQGYKLTYYHHKITEEMEAVSLLENADIAVLVRERVSLSDKVLKSLSSLRMISQTGAGLAHIDLNQVKKQGIMTAVTPGTSLPSVVELTIGLMVACSRMFSIHQRNLQNGQWMQHAGFELRGKRLGLIGFGRIGKEVVKVAQCLGMEVVTWRPTGKKGDESLHNVSVVDLKELLSTSDVVSLHVRLVPELRGFLNRERLKLMKKGSILINTSRGALVDTETLVELLETQYLLGAGIDTFTEEPLVNNPFLHCPNVVLTPHIGYITMEVLQRFANESLQNILDVEEGIMKSVVQLKE